MMFPEGFPEVSRSHQIALMQVDAHDAEAERARRDRAEAHAWRGASMAPEYREQMAVELAAEVRRQQRLEQAELKQAAEKQAQVEDFRDRLLQSGQGRWRTVAEVLAAARGVPA